MLGTIRATVGGEARTWWVVSGESGGQLYASAVWLGSTDSPMLSAGGFETREPPLETFEWDADGMPLSYGDYRESVLAVMIELAGSAPPFTVTLPTDLAAAVTYQREASVERIMETTYMLAEGTIRVASAAVEDGRARMTGTFSGTLRAMEGGEALEITDGTFDVEGIPSTGARNLTKGFSLRKSLPEHGLVGYA